MFGTEGFYVWWLIPLILIGLCFLGQGDVAPGGGIAPKTSLKGTRENSPASALEILGRCYSHGEIDDEEYERKRKTITQEKKGDNNEQFNIKFQP